MSTATDGESESCKDSEMTSKFKWDIFIDLTENNMYYSPVFRSKIWNYNFISMWQLTSNLMDEDLYVSLLSFNQFPVEAKLQFLIFQDAEEKEKDIQTRMRKFQSNDERAETVSYHIPGLEYRNCIEHHSQNTAEYARNSRMHFSITCTIFAEASVSDFRAVLYPNFVVKKRMENFKKILSDSTLSDVILDINGKELKAHKAVLAAHSEVFQKMFSENEQKCTDKKVKIETIEYEVFKELLYFMYAGEFSVSEETILGIIDDLLMAADKYFISDLKDLCEVIIGKNLNVENGLKYLMFADRYNANVLKSEAIQFIVKHSDNFFETPEFKALMESNGKLSFEIMCALNALNKCKQEKI